MNRKLTASSLKIPFKGSFRHASAKRTGTQTIWVTIKSDEGSVGLGEGCPRDYVTGESSESALAFIESIQSAVECLSDLSELRSWEARNQSSIDEHPAAWCAVELALLDVMARETGQSVEALLGLSPLRGPFQYSAVLGVDPEETFLSKLIRYREMGIRHFKVKLDGTEEDFCRDKILCREGETIDTVRYDANNLWSDPATAVAHLKQLRSSCYAVEEPLSLGDYEGCRQLAQALGVRVILDESFLRMAQFTHLEGKTAPWIINLRVSKMGGILRSIEIAREAERRGISLIVGCQVGETSLLTRAALTVVQAIKPDALLAQEGAFGTYLLDSDPVEPSLMFGQGGNLAIDAVLSDSAGFGLVSNQSEKTVLIGGKEKRVIKIADYDSSWPEKYAHHAEIIRKALGGRVLQLEHVGSTSVPGLAAKPIIDIDVVVSDSSDEASYLPALETAGYVLRVREPDWHEHRMLRTPELDVHVHVFSPGSSEVARHLIFRDRLRTHAEDRQDYEMVKRRLAAEDWEDMNAYARAKTEVVERILEKARRETGEDEA